MPCFVVIADSLSVVDGWSSGKFASSWEAGSKCHVIVTLFVILVFGGFFVRVKHLSRALLTTSKTLTQKNAQKR